MPNKVLLINPSYSPSYGGTKAGIVNPICPTLGLATIAATAVERGHKVEILINEKLIKDSEIKIDFNFKNLISPYEVLESPDSRKLGILIKNIKISQI